MSKHNKKKATQLGMPYGTACNRLRKQVLFRLLQQQEKDHCYRCGDAIVHIDQLSMEHKIPWLNSEDPKGLFWDLDNISFSHLSCNAGASRGHEQVKQTKCGTRVKYMTHGCRCKECTQAASKHRQKYRKRVPA